MRITRFDWEGDDPAGLARELRGLQPPLTDVADDVSELIEEVAERRRRGGAAARGALRRQPPRGSCGCPIRTWTPL